jgi:5-methylcytosine-specific restriction endonuclease McrA
MYSLNQQVLRTDPAGVPLEWIGYQEAVKLHCLSEVCATFGRMLYHIHGGINAVTGRRSRLTIHAILATRADGALYDRVFRDYVPPLSNRALFRRDAQLCLYCGGSFPANHLSRDHVTPLSRGGRDEWTNSVTACKRCNNRKAGRTPEEAGLSLLAIPFAPNHAEYIYLKGRRILADQMEFLKAHFPRTSPLCMRDS